MTTASSSRTRKTAQTRPAVRRMDSVEVVELNSEAVKEKAPDLVEIFRIDGRSFSVDANQDASVALEYLHLLRTQGPDHAAAYMLAEVLGQEAYDALRSFKGITAFQLGQVMQAVQTVLMGSADRLPKAH